MDVNGKSLYQGKSLSQYEVYCHGNDLFDNKQYEEAADYYKSFLMSKEGTIDVKLSTCDKLSAIYDYLGDKEKAREYLFKSLQYDAPRAEFCCRLGHDFLERDEINRAIFWYSLALELKKPIYTSVYFEETCWTWLPHLQLGVCYFRLGEYEKANEHNEKVLELEPDNGIAIKNKELIINQIEKKQASYYMLQKQRKSLRIAMIAPDAIPVPPENYGGIERVVFDLTEELTRQGHEVYLYAPKGSHSSATLIPYLHEKVDSAEIAKFVAATLPPNIDIIHDHTHASIIDRLNLPIPTVCTIHDSRPNTAKNPVYLCRRALEMVGGNRGYYVYNGIDPKDYDFSEKKEDYLLFLGVLNWHKGVNYAIDVAERSKQKLVIAGPIYHPEYYNKEIKPRLINNPYVQYVGEVGGQARRELLKNAKCMVFPTSWEEPFGLVMVEAMASGTPVVAFANGAVPEVLSGFPQLICKSVDEMADKLASQQLPAPSSLRDYVMKNFTARIMADNYLKLYNELITKGIYDAIEK